MKTDAILDDLILRYPSLMHIKNEIASAAQLIIETYQVGGKLLLCGNGGSASDCEHIAGELLKGFICKRPLPPEMAQRLGENSGDDSFSTHLQGSLPAISLTGHPAFSTAFANDVDAEYVFAQQVYGLGRAGDCLLAISTSGNARNVLNAITVAKALEIKTIGLTGSTGGQFAGRCDALLCAPASETYLVQEYHLPIYHALCRIIENEFFGDAS